MSTASYHLQELAIARDPANTHRSLPTIRETDRAILDIGCGAGQTLIALNLGTERRLVGVDVDEEALALGRTLTDAVQFLHAPAEAIPLPGYQFDLIISRVALPYTDIPRVADEMFRLLKPITGRCWVTLHPPAFAVHEWRVQAKLRSLRGVVYQTYVIVNGLWFDRTGRVGRYPLKWSRLESVQTERAMRRVFTDAGFADIGFTRDGAFVMTARRC
jgi:ubiquinone/menaquinone biosynthesis C-methylase UbiE